MEGAYEPPLAVFTHDVAMVALAHAAHAAQIARNVRVRASVARQKNVSPQGVRPQRAKLNGPLAGQRWHGAY
jgi:hypothetical protein